jgi:hypothetical protein
MDRSLEMANRFKIPDVIFLQCHDDDGKLFDIDGEEVTWCEDDIDGHNVKFVRQDAILINKTTDGENCSKK